MPYQSRLRAAITGTTLVLLLCFSSISSLAATKNLAVSSAITSSISPAGPGEQSQVSQKSVTTVALAAAPTATPSTKRPTDKQSDQGRQYGEPGFVGEPINLNVVNADIRDILNYVTEQYGVNFVIDSSVSAVPVTVNVQDVPWNVALDAVLKANRLGIEAMENCGGGGGNGGLSSKAGVIGLDNIHDRGIHIA